MRTACLAALVGLAVSTVTYAGPAKTAVDELLCDYNSDALDHMIKMRANGYSQGDTARSAGAFLSNFFTNEFMADPSRRAFLSEKSTKLLQFAYSLPLSDVDGLARNEGLALEIYEDCMRNWF